MVNNPSPRNHLIAGALSGDLSDDEWQEFERVRAVDPTIDAELEELRATVERLKAAGVTWRDGCLPAGFKERILAETIEAEPVDDDE